MIYNIISPQNQNQNQNLRLFVSMPKRNWT